jgi:hypothetical protein
MRGQPTKSVYLGQWSRVESEGHLFLEICHEAVSGVLQLHWLPSLYTAVATWPCLELDLHARSQQNTFEDDRMRMSEWLNNWRYFNDIFHFFNLYSSCSAQRTQCWHHFPWKLDWEQYTQWGPQYFGTQDTLTYRHVRIFCDPVVFLVTYLGNHRWWWSWETAHQVLVRDECAIHVADVGFTGKAYYTGPQHAV